MGIARTRKAFQASSASHYFKYPIPIPIPLNLPNGSALLGLPGLGALMVPLSTHFSSLFTSALFFSLRNPGFGTLSSPFSNHAFFGLLIVPLSNQASNCFSLESSLLPLREDCREGARLEPSPNMRNPSRDPSLERRIGISSTLFEGRRR